MRCLVLLAVLAGCTEHELGESEPVQEKEELKDIPVAINRDLDILFVVDDSCSMVQEQATLAVNFRAFVEVLETIEGGLPNLHIGVVSSDVGGAPFAGCSGEGDDGALLVGDASCRPGVVPYLIDVATASGGRRRNYAGSLADAFVCNAARGTRGCGIEQHLESMRRALDGSQPDNGGFLRDDAYLAVVFIADEDDCSTEDPAMFDHGPHACFAFGVDCEHGNEDPWASGPRSGCHPREDSPFMYDVDEYVAFLRGLKRDPGLVLVSTIVGDPEPVVVDFGPDAPQSGVQPSCESASGTATPAIRLDHFAQQFPHRNAFTSICEPDLSDGMRLFAELVKATLGVPCIEADLVDVDPDTDGLQAECVVSQITDDVESLLPHCPEGASGDLPCWHLVEDRSYCPFTPTGMHLAIERSGVSIAPDSHVIARCRTE